MNTWRKVGCCLIAAVAAFLNGHTLSVRSVRNRNGKRWFETYALAVEDGWVDLGGTDDAPGKIIWNDHL